MDPAELRAVMVALLCDGPTDLAGYLDTKVRTVEDWLAGRRRIRGIVRVACRGLLERRAREPAEMLQRINDRLDRDYPAGIPSEVDPEEVEE